MAGICGTNWGDCPDRAQEEGKRTAPHHCNQWQQSRRDHDHVCKFCGTVRAR